MVDAERPRAVPVRVVEAHEQTVGLLTERVLPQQPLRVRDRLRMFTQALEQLGQPFERLQMPLAEVLPFLEQPLVVAPLQEVAGIDLDGIPQRRGSVVRAAGVGSSERRLEGGDVEPERSVRPPPQRPLTHVEVPVGLGKRPPEVVEDVTEVRLRLRLGRIRPEEEGETLPRLSRLAVEEQVSEQRLRAGRLEPRQG